MNADSISPSPQTGSRTWEIRCSVCGRLKYPYTPERPQEPYTCALCRNGWGNRRASRTAEQARAFTELRALARPHRFRVVADPEGFPIIPGRSGCIERHCDGVDCWSCPLPGQFALAVYSYRRRLFEKLWAIPGVTRHQTGDREMRAVFPLEALDQVGAVIRAKRWGGTGRGRPQNFLAKPGQLATSRPQDRT